MTKEKLIERLKSKAWASHPRGTKDALYLDDAIDLIEELFEQNCIKHDVSGKRPTPDIDKLLHDFAVECGYSDEFHLCAMSENISTEHMKQFALYYQAACASGGVDTKPAREVCIKGGERLENGECAKCNLLWGKCCAELL